MNVKQFFSFESDGKRLPKISLPEKSYASLLDILNGKRAKFMGELAKNFGLYFRLMNLEHSDPILFTLFLAVRNLRLIPAPENIKTLIHRRSILNQLLSHVKSEQSIVLNLLFNACYKIVLQSNSKDEIHKRAEQFCTFFEQLLLHINNK
ncbi:hypothetical protein KDK77_07600 [bacterium]|nr:hypothetical protein [bacterium]